MMLTALLSSSVVAKMIGILGYGIMIVVVLIVVMFVIVVDYIVIDFYYIFIIIFIIISSYLYNMISIKFIQSDHIYFYLIYPY